MCGKTLGTEAFSTIGEQKQYNYALQPMSKEAFVKLVAADQPEAPGYFVHDAILNRQERASLDASMTDTMTALDLETVLKLQGEGGQLVDTRDAADFAGAHLNGSLNIPIDGKYATWAGTILNKESPIVVIADEERVSESIMRLGRIGFDHVAGYLKDGLDALRDHEALLRQTNRITAPAVQQLAAPTIIDVRNEQEWQQGHIEGSVNIPLRDLAERIDEIPAAGDVVIHCQGGYRSTIATSMLQQHGKTNALDLVGGYQAWTQSGLPTQQPISAGSQE